MTDAPSPGFADSLLGRRAVASNESGAKSRWQSIMARFSAEERNPVCAASAISACPARAWRNLVDEIRVLALRDRVERVNAFFNRVPYVSAEFNWHDISHWETPYEFLALGGQCEDYAIAKYLALRESGVPEELLRFVVVHDNLSNLDHALTIVEVNHIPLALDNQLARVTAAWELQKRYDPYYALNEHGWFAFERAAVPELAPVPALFESPFRVARY